jgi:hypothetical protein
MKDVGEFAIVDFAPKIRIGCPIDQQTKRLTSAAESAATIGFRFVEGGAS